jgi:uridine kinase
MLPPILLAITGGSGAGKTWLAERLLAEFPGQAARVSVDDFYRDLSHLPLAGRAQNNFDHPAAIDWRLVESVLDDMLAGRACALPVYDFATHTRRPESRPWLPKPLVIWDGLWLLHQESLRAKFAVRIYVDCPVDMRLQRRVGRDCRERGRSAESVIEQFSRDVAPMHDRFVEPQRQWADVCLVSPVPERDLRHLRQRISGLLGSQVDAL